MVSLIILLAFIFGILMGIRRGFILQLIHLAGFLIAFIVASLYYKKLAGHLSLWIPYPELSNDSAWALFLNTMPLENAFYNAVAFVMIFFVTRIILQIVGYMLDFLANLPLLRTMNKLLGAVLGFAEMYILTFIVLFILALVPVPAIQEKLAGSFLAKLIVKHTPILSSLTENLWFTDSLSQMFS